MSSYSRSHYRDSFAFTNQKQCRNADDQLTMWRIQGSHPCFLTSVVKRCNADDRGRQEQRLRRERRTRRRKRKTAAVISVELGLFLLFELWGRETDEKGTHKNSWESCHIGPAITVEVEGWRQKEKEKIPAGLNPP